MTEYPTILTIDTEICSGNKTVDNLEDIDFPHTLTWGDKQYKIDFNNSSMDGFHINFSKDEPLYYDLVTLTYRLDN